MNRDFAAVAEALSRCRADWLPKYAPAGKIEGGVFYLGDATGSAGRSLPVPLRPNGKPLVDFSAGPVGDDVDLLAALTGWPLGDAYREGLSILGWPDDGSEWAPRRPRRPVLELVEREPEPEAEDKRELAQKIWRQTVRIRDPFALEYLVCRRGITSWDDDRLRWHPECPWGRERVGCIVAPVVCHRTGYTVAIWRIRPSMTEPMDDRRMGFGPTKGNASRLYRTDDERLAIAEGVEDAISFHLLTGWPTWAALNATNMQALILPARFRHVVICQDNDSLKNGHLAGQEAATVLRKRLAAEGRRVELVGACAGNKDANDALRSASHGR